MAMIELRLAPRLAVSMTVASPEKVAELVAGPIAKGDDGEDAGVVLSELLNAETDNTTITGGTPSLVTMDRPGPNTITLPSRITDPTLLLRRPYLLRQRGQGSTSIVGGIGVALEVAPGLTAAMAGPKSAVTVMLMDDLTWWLFGGLAPE